VSGEEVYRSVLAFLSQFISRGAAPDVHDLLNQLARDAETRRLLDEQLPNANPTEREAFDAMTRFLRAVWERGGRQAHAGAPDLIDIISWTTWDIDSGNQQTEDPAQWHDWLNAVRVARHAGGR
jgi:hypothetical protein